MKFFSVRRNIGRLIQILNSVIRYHFDWVNLKVGLVDSYANYSLFLVDACFYFLFAAATAARPPIAKAPKRDAPAAMPTPMRPSFLSAFSAATESCLT